MTSPNVGRFSDTSQARPPPWKCFGAMLVAIGCLALPQMAAAATDTATLSITANVQSGCAVSGGTLDFGNYQSGQTEPLDAAGTISYSNCSGTLTFELDGGQANSVNARAMTNGGSTLSYQLYKTSTRTTVFGEDGDSQVLELQVPLSGTVDVFGRIPGNQVVPTGAYSDTVNIVLTF